MEEISVKTKERNQGIELLRIICMMCMIIQHIIGHGWVIQLLRPDTWKYELVVMLRSLCLFGISGFALISGYVGVQSRFRYSSVVLQWTKVWLYSVFFTVLGSILEPGSVTRGGWFGALLPTLNTTYWYFTAYLGCVMFAPVINKAMKQMTRKQGTVIVVTLIYIFSMFSNALGTDAMYVDVGKGTLWLVILYTVGAYFGHFKPHERVPKAVLWVFAGISTMVMALLQPVAQRLGIAYLSGDPLNNSIQTLLMALAMVLLFSRLEIRRGKRWISWLGGASFGVYVLHEHPYIRKYTITQSYRLTELGNAQLLAAIVLFAAAIYLGCAVVDALRQKIYDRLHLKQKLQAIEHKLIGDLWAD